MQYYLSYRSNPDFNVGFHDLSPFYARSLMNLFDREIYSANRAINLDESDETYTLTLELPGYKQSHLDVVIEDETLTIRAKKDEVNQYERSVTLPRGIDADKVEAKLEDGVLTILLPKTPEVKPRRVTIK